MKRDKIMRSTFFIFLFFVILSPCLQAQTRTETRSIRLVWTADSNAMNYEVKVEVNDKGDFKPVAHELTQESSITVTLPIGRYRCQVIPYDFLEKPGRASRWISFEVKSALSRERPAKPADKTTQEISVNYAEDSGKKRFLPVDLYASAAWLPLIPVYGQIEFSFVEKPTPLGTGIRFGALYPGLEFFTPGLELTSSWFVSTDTSTTVLPDTVYEQKKSGNAFTVGLNAVAQKELASSMALAMRLGAGLAISTEEKSDPASLKYALPPYTKKTVFYWHTLIGVSFLYHFNQRVFFEAGIDYNHFFKTEESPGDQPGCIRPFLGAGVKF